MNNNTITNILKYIIFSGIFLIPFIFLIAPSDPGVKDPSGLIFFANDFFFPFITSKAFVFRIIVEVMFGAWILLMLRDRKYVPKFSWLTVAISSFAVIVLIADLLGMNPLRSIWSNFERMEGWMAIVHIWAYFIVLGSVFQEKKIWHKFFNVSLFVALLASIYGIFQLTGVADIHQGSTRIDASLGNAIYLAVYMLFHIFISLYLLSVSWAKKQPVKVWIYSISTLLFAFILFETGTRGTLIGLMGGGLVMLLILAIFDKAHKKIRIASGSIIVLTILLGILFYANKDATFIQNNETLRRMASISWQDTKTQARGFIWPMAVKGVFDSPKEAIIGLGQENFNYIFNENYEPRMWNQEQWFDRAHSVFLDWLVAAGLLGLIAYLSFFIISLISVWRSGLSLTEKAIFIGLIVGYGIHNVFVFDNLASYVLFFTILAFVHSMESGKSLSWVEKRINTQSENFNIVRDYAIFPVVVILFLVTLYFINVRPIQANLRLVDALRACGTQQTGGSTEFYERALAIDSSMANQEIREQLISCTGAVMNGPYSNEQKQKFLEFLSQEVKKQIDSAPEDARIYVLAGGFYNSTGQFIVSTPLLEKAHKLSPDKQSISFQLAGAYINANRMEDALALYKKAYESEPGYTVAKSSYLSVLVAAGKEDEARKIFSDSPELFETTQIAQIYASIKNYSKSIALYKKLLATNPTDLSLNSQLAQVQNMAGLKYEAIATLRKIAKDHPDLKTQVDEAIKQVEVGG